MLSSNKEDLIDYYQYCRFCRVEREYWVHPYSEKNAKPHPWQQQNCLKQRENVSHECSGSL